MFSFKVFKICEGVEPGPRIYYLGDPFEEVTIYYYFWLLRDGQNNVLVDTGVNYVHGKKFSPTMKQNDWERPLKALAKAGVTREEISHIVVTHLHWDHFSPIAYEFPNAHFYVQRRELETVLNPPHPWFSKFTYKRHVKKLVNEYKDRTHILDGDETILPGLHLFWTGGHTPGHQSVLFDSDFGHAIITGDVVFMYRNLKEDLPVGFNSCLLECFNAMERIRKEGDIIFPGHDPHVLSVVESLEKNTRCH
jgi:glyoxylase-like metal-dependent hydrolase (beta-lactamase superfamily II)